MTPRQATSKTGASGAQQRRSIRHPLTYVFSVIGFFVFLGLGYLYQLVNDPGKFPIERISVDGDFVHLTPTRVQELVSAAVTGGFFSINVESLRETITEHPWIDSASVRRVWPATIKVSIREQRPVARWGDHALLNERADLFAPERGGFPESLPRLHGPIGSETLVLERYRQFDREFASLDIAVKDVTLSERNAWTIDTRDNVRLVFGRDNVDQKLARFRHAYERALKEKWAAIRRVDLRYTNGLTIKTELSG